ncbi:SDR family NAD(P)-dependent oxidoreductase [Streptococcus ratti]|uniref:SDR family NAD(P)-dependent oxidoreductase n=1 Tax=Streptococcus ratti TaxID=1341 RepID=A0A7X9QGP0_STRRT|nr:SDR family NAD(P)-dependent oxidoreductase [Streptococcus ratti]
MGKKYTLITGASSGIGKSTAELFASKGKNLILIARSANALKEVKREINAKYPNLDIVVRDYDLTDIAGLNDLYNSFKEYDIETFINNAGIGLLGSVHENPIEKIIDMINLNSLAVSVLSALYVKDYKDIEGSQLINIASAAGYVTSPGSTAYTASKFFVTSFTESLAQELMMEGSKLRAKVMCPSATSTPFIEKAVGDKEYDYFQNFSTSESVAEQIYELYQSDSVSGLVSFEDNSFTMTGPKFTSLFPK